MLLTLKRNYYILHEKIPDFILKKFIPMTQSSQSKMYYELALLSDPQ